MILSKRIKRLLTAALAVACAALVVAGVRREAASSAEQNRPGGRTSQQRMMRAQLLDGVGKEVQFARRGDSYGAAVSAIKSASRFIRERSGVRLGESVEKRLAGMEHSILKGESRRVSLDELTDVMTDTALERAAAATDEEIDAASQSFRVGPNEDVTLRADGRGQMAPEEFAWQAKELRNSSRQGDGLLRAAVRAAVAEEVRSRARALKEGLPERFGQIDSKGVMPSQALLLAYSVSSNDNLGVATGRLRELTQRENRELKAQGHGARGPVSDAPFGPNGGRYSTPLDLVFDDKTAHGLLDRVERRSKQ